MANAQEAIRRLTVIADEKGVTETTEKVQRFGRAHLAVVEATDKSERATAQMERRLQSIEAQYDKTAKTTRQVEETQAALNTQMQMSGAGTLKAANDNYVFTESQKNVAVGAIELAVRLGFIAALIGRLPGPIGSLIRAFTLLRFAILGTIAAVGAIIGLAIAAIPAFARWEEGMLTLEGVIRATGGAAGRSAQDIDKLEDSLTKATLATGESVKAAAAQLLTFKTVAGDTFDRALKAAVDLSAVGFGSVEQAAVQVAKALEDPEQGLAALRRVGVSFTATQREMITNFVEMGRTADAQRVILQAIEGQVGGAGAARASGLTGAFHLLREVTGDWFELVGGWLASGTHFNSILRSIAGSIKAVNDEMAAASPSGSPLDRTRLQLADTRQFQQNEARLGRTGRVEVLQGEIDRLQTLVLEYEKLDRELERNKEARSRLASDEASTERFQGEIQNLEKEREALKRSELARQQYEAVKRAGATGDPERVAAIEAEVKKNYDLAEALKAEAAAREQSKREAERRVKILPDAIAGLEEEIAKLEVEAETLGMSAQAAERYRIEQELIQAALANNIPLTADLAEKIYNLADQHAALGEALSTVGPLFEESLSYGETYARQIEEITYLEERAKITAEQSAIARANAQKMLVENVAGSLSTLGGLIEGAFGKSKATAIASALLSAGEAIVHSYNAGAKLGGPPLGAVFAGLAAAATARQIAQIRSVSSSGGGNVSSGGSDSAAAATSTTAAAAQPARTVYVELGPTAAGAPGIRDLLEQINEAVGDGANILIRPN